jgi:RimJ/RimL family protein N-acetyltransferase
MIQLTKDVWGGHDYVPTVWERWLHDPQGFPFVAVSGGRVVGLQHAAMHPDGSAWLEGIRVSEEERGRGVGRLLVEAGLAWARDVGATALRLSTSSGNPASNRLAEGAGLAVVDEFRGLGRRAEGPVREDLGVRVAGTVDAPAIRTWLADRGAPVAPFYTEGWTAYRLTPERLQLLLSRNAVAVFAPQGIEALAIATCSAHSPVFRLGFLKGSGAGVDALLAWLPGEAARMGFERVWSLLSVHSKESGALETWGFRPREDSSSMLLRELLLAPTEDGQPVS